MAGPTPKPRTARRSLWSLPAGRYFGIPVRLHVSFLVLLLVLGFLQLQESGSVVQAAITLGSLVALFGCVLLHEFGHALAARQFGIRTRDITLLPIGGVARLERMPEKPAQELWVALAGPLVNAVLAFVFLLALGVAFFFVPEPYGTFGVQTFGFLSLANLLLFGFNLIPAFPMDGGRVLRAFLAMRMDSVRATLIAARIGRILAFGLLVIGLFGNPVLVVIAVFVWFSAVREAYQARILGKLRSTPVANAMTKDFLAFQPNDPLEFAFWQRERFPQDEYPVVSDGRVVGLLAQKDVAGWNRSRTEALVADVMRADFETVQPGDSLESVFARLVEGPSSALPVLEDSRLVGWITLDRIRALLGGTAPPAPQNG